MNINSPVFIPLQQSNVAATNNANDKSPLSSPTATAANFGPWQQHLQLQVNASNYNYYKQHHQHQHQQQRHQQQQFFYHQTAMQQHNFYNPNFHYGHWSKMAPHNQQQQQPQKTNFYKKQQQQQQNQQQRNKIVKPSKVLALTAAAAATAAKLKVTLPTAELKLEAVAAATTAETTDTETTIATTKDDTMQRNGSKASQNSTKSHHRHHHQQHSSPKHDSSDSGISSHDLGVGSGGCGGGAGSQNTNKTRKSGRSSSKRSDCNRSKITATTTTTSSSSVAEDTTFSVDAWLGRDMVYCYERRLIASCAEDNMMPRHNTAHRNSTSSDMAASDELNSSSSNEDLSTAYHVSAKGNKKSTKSRQRRQQKRTKQQSNQTNAHNNTPMDIDDEVKENRRPPNNNEQQQQLTQAAKHSAAAANLRKQCTKAAAIKLAAGATTNKAHSAAASKTTGNALETSTSASSVCSSLSASSSATSIPSSVSSSASSTPNHSPTASPTISKRNAGNFKKIARALAPPLRQHTKLQLTEQQLVTQLRRYVIDPNLLRVYGFPVESAIHEGCIEIYKCLPKPFAMHHQTNGGGTLAGAQNRQSVQHVTSNVINTNDGLYVSSLAFNNDAQQHSSADSGQGSGDSSPPSVDSDSSEAGEDEPATTTAFYTPDGSYQIFSQYDQSLEKQCVRCQSTFHVTETGEYLTQEECRFHWGKLNHMYTSSKGFAYQYSCCEGDETSVGCSSNRLHVWTGAVVGINGPYTGFVHTKHRSGCVGDGGSYYNERSSSAVQTPTKVYALDCEMSFTGLGLEVTKVTVVGYDGQLVYEHFVRPEAEIVDYNTRFSGITANDLCASSTNSVKTLSQVQRDLLQLFDADTLLIGHGLDNDLRVLRIVHKTIIDTSIAFPHASGFPYRRALKHLTKVYLNRDIQCSEAGHSSFEDSRACLELMLWKVRKEMRHDDWATAAQ